MSDIKNALAQLRAARTGDEMAEVAQPSGHQPPETAPDLLPTTGSTEATPSTRGDVKTLAGRVPLALHRELTRALLDAAEELRVSRLNVDEALEAAMRVVLREPQATALWYDQLREVRRERRES